MEIGLFYICFLVLVGIMANKRHRCVGCWVIAALFITPIISILLLLALGDKN